MLDGTLQSQGFACVLLVVGGLLVFFMQAGFCMLEAGAVRSKNTVHVAVKNLFDICVVSVAFLLIGFGFAFGESAWGVIGSPTLLLSGRSSGADLCFAFFQVMFCGTAATIVSGAVTERIKTTAYLYSTLILSLVVYPAVVHWVWATKNGACVGWLGKLGFIDFAGSTVVHGVGAWAALAIVLQLGPRRGRFRSHTDEENPTISSSLTLSTLGVFLLWFGWFGFNAGGAFSDFSTIPLILMNTFVAPAAAGAALLVWQCSRGRLIKLQPIVIGMIGSLVAVTAGCHLLSIYGAMLIGIAGGASSVLFSKLFQRWRVDDPLDVIACHGVAGVVGTVGLVALAPAGAFPMGVLAQLSIQLLGCATVFLYVFSIMSLSTYLWKKFTPLRVTALEEEIGLNVCEHGVRSEFTELLNRARYGDTTSLDTSENRDEIANEFSEYGILRQAIDEMLNAARDETTQLEGVIEETRAGAVEVLIDLCEYRDNETAAHLRRIQMFSVLLAEELRCAYPEIDDAFVNDLRRASLLHDVGKIGIPDSVLLKPGRFTPSERAMMETHTSIGAEILSKARDRIGQDASFFEMAVNVARSHHERYDGAGYPDGKVGEEIPLAARIVAVADVFDALASRRVYKNPMPLLECRALIMSESGQHFDPEVVASFVVVFDQLAMIHRQYADVPEAERLPESESETEEEPVLV